jgi:parallel beta-helix repeat protein
LAAILFALIFRYRRAKEKENNMPARQSGLYLVLLSLALGLAPAPAQCGQILFVDDDGAQCPGALPTIQEAVAQATRGATILVCPGTYRKTVNISGHAKDGVRLIALGGQDEVVLQGDHTEEDGIRLEDVDSVLVRGFTIRDFGNIPTTASQFGNGCGIHLQNANYNTIEHNRVSKTDMMGITVEGSGRNLIRYNFIFEISPGGYGNGIGMYGAKSANNLIFQNYAYRQEAGGIYVNSAGPGNIILDNNFSNNGDRGIYHGNTEGTWIEGNRFSYNAGYRGVSPAAQGPSRGIVLRKSNKVTVFDNTIRGNTAFDISWDKSGEITFANNSCDTADQPGLCAR